MVAAHLGLEVLLAEVVTAQQQAAAAAVDWGATRAAQEAVVVAGAAMEKERWGRGVEAVHHLQEVQCQSTQSKIDSCEQF
jgi:hypothetical protein